MTDQKIGYTLSAQPIDDDGTIGFDDPVPASAIGGVLEATASEIGDCFEQMARKLKRFSRYDCWDLTLSIRRSK